jgi:hypothetical protein
MPVLVAAAQPSRRRLAGERPTNPGLAVLESVLDAATGLLAGIVSAFRWSSRSENHPHICWIAAVATQLRSAIARHVDCRLLGNERAFDIHRGHHEFDHALLHRECRNVGRLSDGRMAGHETDQSSRQGQKSFHLILRGSATVRKAPHSGYWQALLDAFALGCPPRHLPVGPTLHPDLHARPSLERREVRQRLRTARDLCRREMRPAVKAQQAAGLLERAHLRQAADNRVMRTAAPVKVPARSPYQYLATTGPPPNR